MPIEDLSSMKNNPAYYHQSRPEMLALIPPDTTAVLDVGCGSGGFGLGVRERLPECRICGIELFPEVASRVPSVYEKIWVGNVTDVLTEIAESQFDVIVFNDLLEHLVDPYSCLKSCQRLLSPRGKILASIPNMRFWPALSDLVFQADWRYRDAGVMDETHLRFFTQKSIRRMFDECGYDVELIHGINKTWIFSWRWRMLNLIMRGQLSDCLFPQFAVLAGRKVS
jgi:2-polyprenyl-3-methyl-5-hydroxy-6-metoxy-1,4-benzoquinol methylase